MHTLEKLTRTIQTVEDLQSVVRNMKSLAAVSIRQYEKALESLADYNRSVEMGLSVVLRDIKEYPVTTRNQPCTQLGAIVFGSDHGLCGRFNEEIVTFAVAKMNGFQVRHEHRHVLAVGARADAGLQNLRHPVEISFFVPGSADAITMAVQDILLAIDQWQQQRNVHHVLLFYNRHSRGHVHQPTMYHLMPLNIARFSAVQKEPWPSRSIPTYSMDKEDMFRALVRQYFFIAIFRACAESMASEHASRLASMQGAEKNIEERLSELEKIYRQQRQEMITEELLDIVSGYQVLTRTRTQLD